MVQGPLTPYPNTRIIGLAYMSPVSDMKNLPSLCIQIVSSITGFGKTSENRSNSFAESKFGLIFGISKVCAQLEHQAVEISRSLVIIPADVTTCKKVDFDLNKNTFNPRYTTLWFLLYIILHFYSLRFAIYHKFYFHLFIKILQR